MQLFYVPGACSLASHITLREASGDFDLVRVDLATKRTETGEDYLDINTLGYVPALRLDDGHVLTEGAAILQYIADTHPEAALAPAAGGVARAELQSLLNFTSSELHKSFGPLFNSKASQDAKDAAPSEVGRRLDPIEKRLSDGRAYLTGETFTVADAYLYVVASWAVPTGIGLARWPHIEAFVARVAERPSVRAAKAAEA